MHEMKNCHVSLRYAIDNLNMKKTWNNNSFYNDIAGQKTPNIKGVDTYKNPMR